MSQERRYLVDGDVPLLREPSPCGKGHIYHVVENGQEKFVWDSGKTKINVLLTAMAWETGGIMHGDPKLEFNLRNRDFT